MVGLIRNLALSLENHAALRENGLIPILIQLMNKAYQDSTTRQTQNGHPGYIVSWGWVLNVEPWESFVALSK